MNVKDTLIKIFAVICFVAIYAGGMVYVVAFTNASNKVEAAGNPEVNGSYTLRMDGEVLENELTIVSYCRDYNSNNDIVIRCKFDNNCYLVFETNGIGCYYDEKEKLIGVGQFSLLRSDRQLE